MKIVAIGTKSSPATSKWIISKSRESWSKMVLFSWLFPHLKTSVSYWLKEPGPIFKTEWKYRRWSEPGFRSQRLQRFVVKVTERSLIAASLSLSHSLSSSGTRWSRPLPPSPSPYAYALSLSLSLSLPLFIIRNALLLHCLIWWKKKKKTQNNWNYKKCRDEEKAELEKSQRIKNGYENDFSRTNKFRLERTRERSERSG